MASDQIKDLLHRLSSQRLQSGASDWSVYPGPNDKNLVTVIIWARNGNVVQSRQFRVGQSLTPPIENVISDWFLGVQRLRRI